MTVTGWIDVWREADGFWRWRYRSPAEEIDLLANESHPNAAEAERAARLAFPGVHDLRIRRARPDLGRWAKRLAFWAIILWIPRKLFGPIIKQRVGAMIGRFIRSRSD